ncbi:MAG TPA: aminotransferase class IV, partial [Sphaerochaeta sp.]|nr:aminotransferase class IV [Sphaerochaeta sp.]
MYASRNGMIIPKEEAVVPISSREVQSGFYVYESLRVLGGFVTRVNEHLDRLLASAKGIRLTHPFTKETIRRWVDELIKAEGIGDATVRITLYGGADPVLFIVPVELLRYPDFYYRDGVRAITFEGERLFPVHKSGSLLLNYVALEEAKRSGGFEALLVDRKGRVLEGTRSNFFAFSNNTLHTADEDLVLGGI